MSRLRAFMKKVDRDLASGCWLWKGYRNNKGYPKFCYGGRGNVGYAHRWSYEYFIGGIPDGHEIRHTCNRGSDGCVNPHHMKTGTHAQNMRDMAASGVQKGENNPGAKLTNDSVLSLRERFDSGESVSSLAEELGLHVETIRLAVRRKTWKHL